MEHLFTGAFLFYIAQVNKLYGPKETKLYQQRKPAVI